MFLCFPQKWRRFCFFRGFPAENSRKRFLISMGLPTLTTFSFDIFRMFFWPFSPMISEKGRKKHWEQIEKKQKLFQKKNTKSFKFQGLQEGTFLNIIAFVTLSYEPDNLCNKKIISTISIILIAAPIKKNMRKESIAYHHAPIGNQLRALCNPADPAALTPFCRRLNS